MPKKAPKVEFNFSPDPVEDEPLPPLSVEQLEDDMEEQGIPISETRNPNKIHSNINVPDVVDREPIDKEVIFESKKKKKKVIEEEPLPNLAVAPDDIKEELERIRNEYPEPPTPKPQPKKPKGTAKPKRQMSEEHKAKLALAREKALEAKRRKKEERLAQEALDKEEKELMKQQRVKRVKQLKQEVDEPDVPKPVVQQQHMFTKEDLEKAQFDAIQKYDALRKYEKAEKKKKQELERQQAELMRKIQPQQYRYRDGSNRFDMCY